MVGEEDVPHRKTSPLLKATVFVWLHKQKLWALSLCGSLYVCLNSATLLKSNRHLYEMIRKRSNFQAIVFGSTLLTVNIIQKTENVPDMCGKTVIKPNTSRVL